MIEYASVDRIENDLVVLELSDEMRNVSLNVFSTKVEEGQIFQIERKKTGEIEILERDEEEEKRRFEEIQKLFGEINQR